MHRGDAAAATWIFHGVAATSLVEIEDGLRLSRGDRGDVSRRVASRPQAPSAFADGVRLSAADVCAIAGADATFNASYQGDRGMKITFAIQMKLSPNNVRLCCAVMNCIGVNNYHLFI